MSNKARALQASKNCRIRQVVIQIENGIGGVSICPDDVVILNHDNAQGQKMAEIEKERGKK